MKKEMLKGMKMPEKKKDPMLEVDDELFAEDVAYELGEEEGAEMGEMSGALDDISDDELIAEMKKRGLSLEGAEEAEELDMEDEELDEELA